MLMRNLAVGKTYTIILYVQSGKLEESEISENSSEKEVKSVFLTKSQLQDDGELAVFAP